MKILVSKNLNQLFVGNLCRTGVEFNLLNKSKLEKVKKDSLIEIKQDDILFSVLIEKRETKVLLAEILIPKIKDRAPFIGVSERTYFRIREKVNF
jgi:hypothetical protein